MGLPPAQFALMEAGDTIIRPIGFAMSVGPRGIVREVQYRAQDFFTYLDVNLHVRT